MSATTTELVACEDVSVVHGHGDARVVALDGVNLRVEDGERVALVGASGSGKTTLLHVLGGLLVPQHGRVTVRGEPLGSLDAAARGATRAAHVAYVFQGGALLPWFTAYENVAFATQVSRRASIDPGELLALVGLAKKLEALPSELSGGEAQRVAIARALAQGAELLLCDEPTGHLDSATGARTLDLIEALQKEFAFAWVMATHDDTVAARSQRIVDLEDGRVTGERGAT